MPAQITEEDFLARVRGFRESAFRLETRESYALDYEEKEFRRFRAGVPTAPTDIEWWGPWFGRVARFAREGKTIGRVRVVDEPPTDYQRWMLWADRWHAEAGEVIRYIPRSKAVSIGLVRGYDWWLLDDRSVIIMRFTEAGEIDRKELIEEPGSVARFQAWRDLAIRNASPAAQVAAA